jgi:glycosyltransferase involved in cell wall biosynthesis
MKLSVIVPVYKAEHTLRKCVDSLLAQTLGDLEIILVNDGSPDGCQAILDDYAARFPDKIRTKTVSNGGQGRARNFGLELAGGDWIGFVDSDDWVFPDMYARLIRAAEERGTDVAVCDVLRCFEGGGSELLRAWREGKPLAAAGSCCDKVFRRGLIRDLRFPEGLWYEDFAFSALALARCGEIAYVPEALYFYRVGHPSTMHNQNARKNLDLLAVLDLLRRPLLDAGRKDDYESLMLNHALLDAVNRVQRQNGEEKFAIINEIRDYVNQTIPDLGACPAYRAESGKRRLVMWLNYHGLNKLSGALLRLKNGPEA